MFAKIMHMKMNILHIFNRVFNKPAPKRAVGRLSKIAETAPNLARKEKIRLSRAFGIFILRGFQHFCGKSC